MTADPVTPLRRLRIVRRVIRKGPVRTTCRPLQAVLGWYGTDRQIRYWTVECGVGTIRVITMAERSRYSGTRGPMSFFQVSDSYTAA